MAVNETNLQFVSEAFQMMFDAYFATLDLRKDEPYTSEDVRTQDAVYRRWLADGLFSDPVVRNLIPRDVWCCPTRHRL